MLTDFGISRSPDDRAEGGGTSFGTLAYMSPEQAEGQSVDHRSDIYSLGVVLYELLVGHLPHDGPDPVDVRWRIVAGTVPPLTGVSKELERICRKCLSRSPNDRYQDAGELAAALRQVAVSSRRTSRRFVFLVGGVLLVALVVVAVVAFRQLRQPEMDQPDTPGTLGQEPKELQPAPDSPEAALALGKLHFDNKEWVQAEAAFIEAIRLNPKCAEAYHRRAGSVFNAGRVKESLPDFDTAARLDPTNPEVYKNRGIAYLNLLRFDEALAELKHALELAPDHPESYRKVLGQTYARRAYEHVQAKRPTEAMADMEAIQYDATTADYFDKRGSLHYNLRQYDEALKDFTEAVRLDPRQPTYYLHRGYAHQALGRTQEAADDFKKAKSGAASLDGR